MTDRLPDRWYSRDFPVLLETARLLDADTETVRTRDLVDPTSLNASDVLAALAALTPAYLHGFPVETEAGLHDVVVDGLTERGRRAVGLWPSGEGADALVDALRQAEERTEDPEEKSLLRRAAGAVGSVSRDVMADVIAALIRQQTGL